MGESCGLVYIYIYIFVYDRLHIKTTLMRLIEFSNMYIINIHVSTCICVNIHTVFCVFCVLARFAVPLIRLCGSGMVISKATPKGKLRGN